MNRADSYDALARLLDYPEDKQQLQSDYDLVSSFLKRQRIDNSLADFAANASQASLQEEYVATFDFNPATSPYLGHHLFGDNQKKGSYMIMLKQEFARYGYTQTGVELPDHLSVVLGFLAHLARTDDGKFRQPFIITCVVPGVERLGSAFAEKQDSPWKPLVEAARLLCLDDCKEAPSC